MVGFLLAHSASMLLMTVQIPREQIDARERADTSPGGSDKGKSKDRRQGGPEVGWKLHEEQLEGPQLTKGRESYAKATTTEQQSSLHSQVNIFSESEDGFGGGDDDFLADSDCA